MKSVHRLSLKTGDQIYIDQSVVKPGSIVGPYRIDRTNWLQALQEYNPNMEWYIDYWPVTKLSFRVLGKING